MRACPAQCPLHALISVGAAPSRPLKPPDPDCHLPGIISPLWPGDQPFFSWQEPWPQACTQTTFTLLLTQTALRLPGGRRVSKQEGTPILEMEMTPFSFHSQPCPSFDLISCTWI